MLYVLMAIVSRSIVVMCTALCAGNDLNMS